MWLHYNLFILWYEFIKFYNNPFHKFIIISQTFNKLSCISIMKSSALRATEGSFLQESLWNRDNLVNCSN